MSWFLQLVFYTLATGGCLFNKPMSDRDGMFFLYCGRISCLHWVQQ